MSNPGPGMIGAPPAKRISVWLKVLYTAFVCVLVPVYWRDYGPTNFMYFCDVAVFLTLAAMWTESSLLASMPAVGILAPQLLWMVDFLGECVGLSLMGMTAYMFEERIPFFTRCLSFFHFWLPILIVWLVWRLRYDSRAFRGWTIMAWGLMLILLLLDACSAGIEDPDQPVNINYVYGLGRERPRDWMPPLVYLGLMLAVMPLAIFLPTHLTLRWLFEPRRAADIPIE